MKAKICNVVGRIVMIALILSLISIDLQGQTKKIRFDRSDLQKLPKPPDYTNLDHWAAHPDKPDAADLVPGKDQLRNEQSSATVDVFFVHPTIYTEKQDPDHPWNADIYDRELNLKVDESTIKNQAGVFNGSARVYAPRYRQAHLNIWKADDSELKEKALDHAYTDVREAFSYFLHHENQGRPVIIAGHSQGTVHSARLLREFFDGTDLQDQLVAAYIIGMPLRRDLFEEIPYCEKADQTGCWITWNTYKKGYYPEAFNRMYANALNVNPLNWRIDDTYAARDENMGGVLKNFNRIIPRVTDAQNYKGILWVEKPHFFWRFLLWKKRYHIADYNLFYMNIRGNVAQRVGRYFEYPSKDVVGSGN